MASHAPLTPRRAVVDEHMETRGQRRKPVPALRVVAAQSATVLGVGLALVQADPSLARSDTRLAAVQWALSSRGYYTGSIDGLDGPETRRALQGYWRDSRFARLPERTALPRILADLGRPTLGRRVLRRGASGADVLALQFELARHGFPSAWFDGLFGQRTESALRRFQRSHRLPVDGIAGKATLAALSGNPPTPDRILSWPVNGPLTSAFGPRGTRFHAGVDISAVEGTPVFAAAAGRVAWAGERAGGWGNLVVVAHQRRLRTFYAHLARIEVTVGERVNRGAHIGLVGNTGTSSGAHLHFEVRLRGAAVDPLLALTNGATAARAVAVAYIDRPVPPSRGSSKNRPATT